MFSPLRQWVDVLASTWTVSRLTNYPHSGAPKRCRRNIGVNAVQAEQDLNGIPVQELCCAKVAPGIPERLRKYGESKISGGQGVERGCARYATASQPAR